MIKSVIFDWNGVLIADTGACFEADNFIIKSFGGNPINLAEYRETVSIPSIDFYAMHGANHKKLNNNPKKWAVLFHKFYERRASNLRTRKGAKEILNFLYKRGIKSVILSNHTTTGINNQIYRLKIKKYFDCVLANSDSEISLIQKTKTQRLMHYLKNGKCKKSETLIVGDSPEEIETGKKLGLKTVAITNGYYSTSRLKKAKPDYMINNLNELKEIIQ